MKVQLAGVDVELLPERALWLPERRTLLIADLHAGKAETFQRHGIAVPSAAGDRDVERLFAVLRRTGARQLYVLGDLVHGGEAAELAIGAWLQQRHPDVALHVVCGNHDRHVPEHAPAWRGMHRHRGGVELPPFVLRHEPAVVAGAYVLAGHLHPMARLRAGGDDLLLPCFHFGPSCGVLPAFTLFASGVRMPRHDGRTFVVAGDRLVAL